MKSFSITFHAFPEHKSRLFFILLIIFSHFSFSAELKAQSDSVESVVLFPQDLNFLPLKGYASEPRLGIIYYTATTNLKVDVGTTLELLQFRLPDTAADIKVGIEFMAYAYSTSYSGYRLQISTLDGMFGGHAAYLHEAKDMTTSIRFRYIHNSAHLVDGNYIPATNSWINDKLPIPFTRDFAELTYAPIFHQSFAHIRPYAGCTQAFRVRPEVIKRASYFTGLELYSRSPLTSILKKPVILFASYHLQINGVPEYTASHDFQAGFKIGEWNKKGVNFFLSYFHGNNVFNEYYNERIDRFGVGFSVDFPG